MLTFTDELTIELLRDLRTPKRIEDVKLPSSPTPVAMGQPNPHWVEAVRRQCSKLEAQGLVTLKSEDAANATGARRFTRTDGRWQTTEKGFGEIKAAAEREDREEKARVGLK